MHMKLMEEETMRGGEEEEEKGDDNSEGERRIMAGGGGEKKRNVNKGCIKAGKGPWLVHRTTKDGSVITRFRYPSDRERQNNKRRERARRSMTRRIFQGLRAHGNYELPKHADSNDLLRALCQEAGWHVDEDGHVSRQETQMTSFNISGRRHFYPVSMGADQLGDHEDYCKCIHSFSAKGRKLGCTFNFPTATSRNQYDQNGFTLSPSRHRLATNENWR